MIRFDFHYFVAYDTPYHDVAALIDATPYASADAATLLLPLRYFSYRQPHDAR